MREKDYNLELIRMASFVLVIAIHVSNYFCRAYGEIPDGEYLFSLAVDTFARVSVPCFFMISGALLLGRDEPLEKALETDPPVLPGSRGLERHLLSLEHLLHEVGLLTCEKSSTCPPRRTSGTCTP